MLKTKIKITLLVALTAATCVIGAATQERPSSGAFVAASAYKLEDGAHRVATIENLVLRDERRNKNLSVTIQYPEGEGRFPVIVFSHGAGGSGNNYFPLTRFWASHGYIVLQPTHADSLSLRRAQGDEGGLREVLSEMGASGGVERARDVSFLIDSLAELERRAPALRSRIIASQIGVAGHSYGAYTTQLIGGATVNLSGREQSVADRRVSAVMLLSPQGRDEEQLGLTESSWRTLARPMMLMTGSMDRGRVGQTPEWRREPFRFVPAGDKYEVFIEGAHHFSFTGRVAGRGEGMSLRDRMIARRAAGTNQETIFNVVKTASIAFWDAHLRGSDEARNFLASNRLQTFGQGQVSFSRR